MAVSSHHLLDFLGFLFAFHDGQRVKRKTLTKWFFLRVKYKLVLWGFISPSQNSSSIYPSLHEKKKSLFMWRISVRKISSISVIWQVSALQFSSKSYFELAVSEEMTLSLYGFEKRKQKVSSAWRWTLVVMPVGGVSCHFIFVQQLRLCKNCLKTDLPGMRV